MCGTDLRRSPQLVVTSNSGTRPFRGHLALAADKTSITEPFQRIVYIYVVVLSGFSMDHSEAHIDADTRKQITDESYHEQHRKKRRNEAYLLRRRAEAVGLKPLKGGRQRENVRKEWIRELRNREKIQGIK